MAREEKPGHVAMLDGVRGLAVVMVVACHMFGPLPDTGVVTRSLRHLIAYGALGVDVFFLLSGYLITGILLRSRGDAHYYRNFYARRVLRIFPLHYATLLVVLVLLPLVSRYARGELAPTLPHQGWAWLYAVNFFYLFHPGGELRYLAHFWSLAVEEHFYLVWPFVVRASSPRGLARICGLLAIFSLVSRVLAPRYGVDEVSVSMLTPLRIDTLCLGALLAVWQWEQRQRRFILKVAAIVGGASLAIGVMTVLAQRWSPATTELARNIRGVDANLILWAGFAALLVSGSRSIVRRLFSSAVPGFFGKYSYGIYVIHAIVGLALFRAHAVKKLASRVGSVPMAVGLIAVATTIVSVALALVSYRFLESPFLALKKRFAPAGDRKAGVSQSIASTQVVPAEIVLGPGEEPHPG